LAEEKVNPAFDFENKIYETHLWSKSKGKIEIKKVKNIEIQTTVISDKYILVSKLEDNKLVEMYLHHIPDIYGEGDLK